MNDIVINKIQSIHRCIERARADYKAAGENFATDYTHQDAAILNIVRACELAIDLANHVIKSQKLGIPTSNAESFELLKRKRIIRPELEQKMKNMVGFRNIAVHQYQRLNIAVVEAIIKSDLDDLILFGDAIMEFVDK
jgi:uncharacterized protein YutE (UPF0331/DUF86 family)